MTISVLNTKRKICEKQTRTSFRHFAERIFKQHSLHSNRTCPPMLTRTLIPIALLSDYAMYIVATGQSDTYLKGLHFSQSPLRVEFAKKKKFKMRNSEFRIRNSEFRIRNSEFLDRFERNLPRLIIFSVP